MSSMHTEDWYLERCLDPKYVHSRAEKQLVKEIMRLKKENDLLKERMVTICESHRDAVRVIEECTQGLQGAATGLRDEVEAEYALVTRKR